MLQRKFQIVELKGKGGKFKIIFELTPFLVLFDFIHIQILIPSWDIQLIEKNDHNSL